MFLLNCPFQSLEKETERPSSTHVPSWHLPQCSNGDMCWVTVISIHLICRWAKHLEKACYLSFISLCLRVYFIVDYFYVLLPSYLIPSISKKVEMNPDTPGLFLWRYFGILRWYCVNIFATILFCYLPPERRQSRPDSNCPLHLNWSTWFSYIILSLIS